MENLSSSINDELVEFSEDNLVICDMKNRNISIMGKILMTMGHRELEVLSLSWEAAFCHIYELDQNVTVDFSSKIRNFRSPKFQSLITWPVFNRFL